jgi:hypothetical protein
MFPRYTKHHKTTLDEYLELHDLYVQQMRKTADLQDQVTELTNEKIKLSLKLNEMQGWYM